MLCDSPVSLVEAPSGFGKTTLAAELAKQHPGPVVWLRVDLDDTDAGTLLAVLRAGLTRAGFTEAVLALADDIDTTVVRDVLCGLGAAAGGDPLLIVVDDAHRLDPSGSALLIGAVAGAAATVDGLRLVVLARLLPPEVHDLRHVVGAPLVGVDALRFTVADTVTLLAHLGDGEGTPDDEGAADLRRSTDGWATAIVLAGLDRDRAITGSTAGDVLRRLVDDKVAALSPADQVAVCQLAQLEVFDRTVAEAVGGPGILTRLVAAGMPLSPVTGRRYELPGPVQDRLAVRHPLDPEVARRASKAFAESGAAMAGLRALMRCGDEAGALELLANLTQSQLDELEPLELRSLVDQIEPAVLDANPAAILAVVRNHAGVGQYRLRSQILGRGLALTEPKGRARDPVLHRAFLAEHLRDRGSNESPVRTEPEARALLAAVQSTEPLTKARALEALAVALRFSDHPETIEEAIACCRQAVAITELQGQRRWTASTLEVAGAFISFECGQFDEAIEFLERALRMLPDRSRRRASCLFRLADILAYLGRDDQAAPLLREIEALGRTIRESRFVAYAAIGRAIAAAHAGNVTELHDQVRIIDENRGEWFYAHLSGPFSRSVTTRLLLRVGSNEMARQHLADAVARRDEASVYVHMAELTMAARLDDAEHALVLADTVPLADLEPRDRWMVPFWRALAHHRLGDLAAAKDCAARAFAATARLGHPDLPEIHEGRVAVLLRQLVDGGAEPASTRTTITTLGSFVVRVDGRPIELRHGQAAEALMCLIAVGRRLSLEEVVDRLWPDVALEVGRKRLRNVLSRLRDLAGDLVERDGDGVRLVDDVTVDADEFQTAAAEALRHAGDPAGVALARQAIAWYAGDFLPTHTYADWSALRREHLRRTCLALVDLIADEALRQGDVDDALRHHQRGIDLDPLDDTRYVRAATLLAEVGRRAAAASMLRQADAALDELGLNRSDPHRELVKRLGL